MANITPVAKMSDIDAGVKNETKPLFKNSQIRMVLVDPEVADVKDDPETG